MKHPDRRHVLGAMVAAAAATPVAACATVIDGALPWEPDHTAPPQPVDAAGWRYFTPDEARAVEALVDRLIPPDAQWAGGRDAGCAVFIDRQLDGPYGHFEGLYMSGPFHGGTEEQGPQSPTTPAAQYRTALAALDRHCRESHGGATFASLPDADKDAVLHLLEAGRLEVGGKPGDFFKQLLKDTQEGFFADPLYGGNRDMVAWRMIGFPGARYDYRDWVTRHNERYPLPPIGIADHPRWKG